MPSYSAAQIVGKNLVAKRHIEIKRTPSGSAKVVYTAAPGSNVGTVYSWTGGNAGAPLWWMFYDQKGKTYYALHEPGAFDIGSIKDQGALDVKEEREAEAERQEQQGGLGIEIPNPFKNLNLQTPITIAVLAIGAALAFSLLRKK